jgi:hypothetical protein
VKSQLYTCNIKKSPGWFVSSKPQLLRNSLFDGYSCKVGILDLKKIALGNNLGVEIKANL